MKIPYDIVRARLVKRKKNKNKFKGTVTDFQNKMCNHCVKVGYTENEVFVSFLTIGRADGPSVRPVFSEQGVSGGQSLDGRLTIQSPLKVPLAVTMGPKEVRQWDGVDQQSKLLLCSGVRTSDLPLPKRLNIGRRFVTRSVAYGRKSGASFGSPIRTNNGKVSTPLTPCPYTPLHGFQVSTTSVPRP